MNGKTGIGVTNRRIRSRMQIDGKLLFALAEIKRSNRDIIFTIII